MAEASHLENMIKRSLRQLLVYCKKNGWAGYDPYDGLNSQLFNALPFANYRIPRLIFIQGMKWLPINLRPLFLVSKEQNPKGLALFISALINLSKQKLINAEGMVLNLINRLIDLHSPNQPYYCWGYNFDWQNRGFLLPKYEPNIIATTFAGNALIDAYVKYGDQRYLEMAKSARQFLLNGLNISKTGAGICFSYTPYDHGRIHNANLLGAAFLARLYSVDKDDQLLDVAMKATKYSVSKQNPDGSWYYGDHKTQQWIDNFHTGYNLIALKNFACYAKCYEFREVMSRGFRYYIEHFFTPADKLPKYFHDHLYPIDIHSVAYSIITLVEFADLDEDAGDLAAEIISWAIEKMQDRQGYFYYQKNRLYINRISYTRWSQAWMLYAMSIFLKKWNLFFV